MSDRARSAGTLSPAPGEAELASRDSDASNPGEPRPRGAVIAKAEGR